MRKIVFLRVKSIDWWNEMAGSCELHGLDVEVHCGLFELLKTTFFGYKLITN